MRKLLCILSFYCCFNAFITAQISHGGTPLFLFPTEKNGLRSAPSTEDLFIEMPPFDLDSILAKDKLNESNMRGAFQFANKFHTSIERGKSGRNFTLPDGTKVWQVGIYSEGALSINVLFSEFHIPEGSRLFLYNADHTHILGSFTSENNSEDDLFPVSPVEGDKIIVEYTEPANAAFEGKLKITEVNHDYRGILRAYREPTTDPLNFACMPDVLCSLSSSSSKEMNSVVLFIVDGTTSCTGTLVNNTNQDGTPYMLTAMHCFNNSPTLVPQTMQRYMELAGSIVVFFNYNRPICGTKMKGTEEMSLVKAKAVSIIEKCDIALLKLNDTPPAYYQPYYAGWNINTNGGGSGLHSNIHHPEASVKKYGESTKPIALSTYSDTYNPNFFNTNSHWRVPGWTTGSTASGSSGSPLFDNEKLVVGCLTGGNSNCSGTIPDGGFDYFYALHKGWQFNPLYDSLQLKPWLDPGSIVVGLKCPGFDPNAADPFYRVANAQYSNGDALVNTLVTSPNTGCLFGHNSLGVAEYAEEFNSSQKMEIYGTYFLNPSIHQNYIVGITVHVYEADGDKPGAKILSIPFQPKYTGYSGGTSGDFLDQNKKTLNVNGTESFIRFPGNLLVQGKFFIGYQITYPQATTPFSTYNATFGSAKPNTAWIKDPVNGWIKASENATQPVTTSLAIQPLLKYLPSTSIDEVKGLSPIVKYSRNDMKIEVNCQNNESGIVQVYTVTGVLTHQFRYSGPESFFINPALQNMPGIIQFKSEKTTETLKVIF